MEKLEKTAAALRRRGFDAAIFETAKEAADYLLSDMPGRGNRRASAAA